MGLTDLFFMALLMVRELIINYPHISSLIVLGICIPWGIALWKRTNTTQGWKRVWKPALLFTIISGVVAFFLLPVFFHSGTQHLTYMTDWLFHIASVVSIMIYAWLIAVPALLLWCSCSK